MRFSQLVATLKQGEAGVLDAATGRDPDLRGAASLDRAQADQLSFLEQGNALISRSGDQFCRSGSDSRPSRSEGVG